MPQRPLEDRRAVGRQTSHDVGAPLAAPSSSDPPLTAPALVRDATLADIPALLDVINPAYKRADGFIFPHGTRTDADELRELIEDSSSRLLVAEIDGEVAGSIQLDIDGDRAHFGPLATSIAHQQRGVASTLIAAAEDIARAAGCATLRIEAIGEVGWVPYYEKRGYTVVAQIPSDRWPGSERWGGVRPWTMVEMKKDLP